ncbi:unnamed protein product [Ambrosiozyma monospora]|uniref:Unnamed protein product n=1 Tax=Ambrosiozyma monospora TaxID=43982 RepID=A0ACB5T7U0_AMBMO|nr:unnamed protein product [Ambrosiozyma monospora]
MSFFQNDPASCAANNSLNKFSAQAKGGLNHLQFSSSFQQQQQQQQQQLNNFNTVQSVDQALQNEFDSFGSPVSPILNSHSIPNSLPLHSPPLQSPPIHHAPQLQHQGSQGWISDFQHMNLKEQQYHNEQNQARSPLPVQSVNQQWSAQFTQSSTNTASLQNHSHSQQPLFHGTSGNSTLINDSVYRLQNRGLLNNNTTVSETQEQSQYQHQHEENVFDQAFNDIEMELNEQKQHQAPSVADQLMEGVEQQQYQDQQFQTSDARTATINKEQGTAPTTTATESEQQQQQQPENPVSESSKIEFAKLAQSVFQTMSNTPSNISTTTSTKFKNSHWLTHVLETMCVPRH